MEETKTVKTKSLNLRLAEIQRTLNAPKSRFNKFANFSYRSCEDILEAVKPLLNGLILTLTDEPILIGDRYYVKAVAHLSDGSTDVEVSAYARESDVKTGMDAAQITGAASSYARKYALNGLFLIDDGDDADAKDNTAPTTKRAPKPTADTPTSPLNAPRIKDYFKDDVGGVARDTRGLTACVACGRGVTKKVEEYSLQKYEKVLCMTCQKKEMGGDQ